MIVIRQQDITNSEIMNPATYFLSELEENHRAIFLVLVIMFILFVIVDVRARIPAKTVIPEVLANAKACESNTSSKKKVCAFDSKENSVLIKKSD